MAQRTTFMTLPPELRERVYEYIAASHTTRSVHYLPDTHQYKTTTSAITATCRLVHKEYEAVSRKSTTSLDFTTTDMDMSHIIDYFQHHVDAKYLGTLQQNQTKYFATLGQNGATINVHIVLRDSNNAQFTIPKFYAWALFLINVKLEAAYQGDPLMWMVIHEATNPDLAEQCLVEEDTPQAVCENMTEIRRLADVFDRAVWRAYPKYCEELQIRRHRALGLPYTRRGRAVESRFGTGSA